MTDDHEQLDPAEALMREVGAQLRQVRLERGEELDEVALHLRIKSTYLFGIEQGDLSRLPGRTYALGFLRSYADYLGFDGDDLIVQIKSAVANLTDRTRLRIRTPLPESRLPKIPILVLSLAVIAAIYGGWSWLGRNGQLALETVAEVPGNLRSMALDGLAGDNDAAGTRPASPPASAALPAASADGQAAAPATAMRSPPPATTAATTIAPAPRPAEAVAQRPAAAPDERPNGGLAIDERGLSLVRPEAGAPRQQLAAAAPETPSAAGAPARAPGPAATPIVTPAEDLARRAERPPVADASPDDEPAPGEDILAALAPAAGLADGSGQVYEAENADARVVLRARDSSWIRISSLGGDYLRTHTLQRGDVFLVPNRSDLELWTGNAGGIEVIVDGTLLAPVGADGAVVREVPLDPPSLRARFGHP